LEEGLRHGEVRVRVKGRGIEPLKHTNGTLISKGSD